jgi:hypothetical protein
VAAEKAPCHVWSWRLAGKAAKIMAKIFGNENMKEMK